MASVKTNTKKVTSYIFIDHLIRAAITGTLLGMVLLLYAVTSDFQGTVDGFVILSVLILAFSLIIGAIAGLIRTSFLKRRIRRQEAAASISFDEDRIQPAAGSKEIAAGEQWLLEHHGLKFRVLAKNNIQNLESFRNGKRGYTRIRTQDGKLQGLSYKDREGSVLAFLNGWSNAANVTSANPSERKTETQLAPGTCPHCLGPNEPGAQTCQWCGSALEPEKPSVQPAAVNEPLKRSEPVEERTGSDKGTWITVAILSVILLALIAVLYLR